MKPEALQRLADEDLMPLVARKDPDAFEVFYDTLTVTNMPRVEGDDVYQVWIQHGDRVQPSSAFRPDPTGSVEAEIPSDLDGADAVMVTLEPERGRTKPSLPALFESDLD